MQPLGRQEIQVLRTMDKCDNIGIAGVVELLQKPESESGANLGPVRARLIGAFLSTKGADNTETIGNIIGWFEHASKLHDVVDTMLSSPLVVSRCKILVVLDDDVLMPDGQTGLDFLLALPQNKDQTWRGGGRPSNLGWAMDDLASKAAARGVSESGLAEHLKGALLALETQEDDR